MYCISLETKYPEFAPGTSCLCCAAPALCVQSRSPSLWQLAEMVYNMFSRLRNVAACLRLIKNLSQALKCRIVYVRHLG